MQQTLGHGDFHPEPRECPVWEFWEDTVCRFAVFLSSICYFCLVTHLYGKPPSCCMLLQVVWGSLLLCRRAIIVIYNYM